MKVVKSTRYVVEPRNRIARFLIRLLSNWTTPLETKHFLILEDRVIEFCEVHTWVKQADSMHLFPDKYERLEPSGHTHRGKPSYYPY